MIFLTLGSRGDYSGSNLPIRCLIIPKFLVEHPSRIKPLSSYIKASSPHIPHPAAAVSLFLKILAGIRYPLAYISGGFVYGNALKLIMASLRQSMIWKREKENTDQKWKEKRANEAWDRIRKDARQDSRPVGSNYINPCCFFKDHIQSW